ncbi:MAG: spore coat protein CotJB [Ruminococcaceae bacterium]|nr:spore coat protein CotJB [Oscillospiraceae bacterium]
MNKETLMREIMALDFALNDLKLYLNTHPDDEKSIELFNKIATKGKELFDTYQSMYGPLIAEMYTGSEHTWDWIECPWPWNKKEV